MLIDIKERKKLEFPSSACLHVVEIPKVLEMAWNFFCGLEYVLRYGILGGRLSWKCPEILFKLLFFSLDSSFNQTYGNGFSYLRTSKCGNSWMYEVPGFFSLFFACSVETVEIIYCFHRLRASRQISILIVSEIEQTNDFLQRSHHNISGFLMTPRETEFKWNLGTISNLLIIY